MLISFLIAMVGFTIYFWMDEEVKKGKEFMSRHFKKEDY